MRKTRSVAFNKPCICLGLLTLMMFFSFGCSSENEDYVSVREGRFLDSPVEGLAYICGGQTGVTDKNGTFFYEKGKDITFKIGNIVLGSVPTVLNLPPGEEAPEIITFSPRNLVPEAESNRDPQVTNILQFLQTLDEDYNPDNGIFLSESVRGEAEKYSAEVDFSLSPDEFEASIQPIIADLLNEERELVSRIRAQNHFMRTLIQAILDDAVKLHKVPGVALVAEVPCAGSECANGEMDGVDYEDGKFMWKLSSGYTDMENETPVTADTRFRIASLTKTFIAMATLKLVEEGKISLDDTVEKWLPGLIPQGADMTVRQVMNHSSGLFNFYHTPSPWFLDFLLRPYGNTWEQEELIEISVEHGLNFPSGMGWHYSNTNYVLLGMIIEEVTGDTWEDEIRERFIMPYGLNDTIIPETGEVYLEGEYAQVEDPDVPPYNTSDAVYAHGYVDLNGLTGGMYGDPGGVLINASDREPSALSSSGNMISTPENLFQWMKLIGEGSLFGEDSDFVNDNVDEELYFPMNPVVSCGPNVYKNYASNMLIVSGNFPGYDVGMVYSLDDRIPMAVCSNRTLSSGQIKDIVTFDAIDILGGGLSDI